MELWWTSWFHSELVGCILVEYQPFPGVEWDQVSSAKLIFRVSRVRWKGGQFSGAVMPRVSGMLELTDLTGMVLELTDLTGMADFTHPLLIHLRCGLLEPRVLEMWNMEHSEAPMSWAGCWNGVTPLWWTSVGPLEAVEYWNCLCLEMWIRELLLALVFGRDFGSDTDRLGWVYLMKNLQNSWRSLNSKQVMEFLVIKWLDTGE